ncbi:hypothetical protein AVEN_130292-1 [Araneus ventricosus]|uniref:Uncharacterized protein n=1 Tax=Araneus ventricosus TaxID=182803 RepID=A0A4Y2UT66_ARAVE|nr:hypothetical protein AVEN_130292-1 [Araneus ventricosus]
MSLSSDLERNPAPFFNPHPPTLSDIENGGCPSPHTLERGSVFVYAKAAARMFPFINDPIFGFYLFPLIPVDKLTETMAFYMEMDLAVCHLLLSKVNKTSCASGEE